jgi:hypothetical protein
LSFSGDKKNSRLGARIADLLTKQMAPRINHETQRLAANYSNSPWPAIRAISAFGPYAMNQTIRTASALKGRPDSVWTRPD